jgi:hypothetical protein
MFFRYATAHMNLDEKQKEQVAGWLRDGAGLADVQKRIESEFGVSATYMEVKFLVSDLDLTPKDPEPEKPVEPEAKPGVPASDDDSDGMPAEAVDVETLPPAGLGNVSVEVDQLARPGSMVSGKVTFANGKISEWMLDQMGRLGVVPSEDGYKPSQADLQQFQTVLQKELEKMGM